MQLSLATFLERRGFQHNPFETTRAERERDLLPGWFRPSMLFERLVGDPTRPETCLLFAPTGHGKTSHRMEVARRVQERVEGPALAVELTDFDVLLQQGVERVTLDAYIAQIHRLFLEAVVAQLYTSPERLRRLQSDHLSYTTFCALLYLHARDLLAGFFRSPQTEERAELLQQQQRGARQRLATLVALAQAVGFVSIYILVDGVDELNETRHNPALMAHMLAALLDAPGVLEAPGLAFKFFLPIQLREILLSEQIGRLDIFHAIPLTWSDADLREMLATRLRMCSQLSSTSQGSTHCFSDLCAADFDVDGQLAAAARGSPRRLLRLCREIVELHLARTADPDEPIAAATVAAVLEREATVMAHASAPEIVLAGAAEPLPAPPIAVVPELAAPPVAAASELAAPPVAVAPEPAGTPPLGIDNRGDIWLGARRLEQRLPPSLRQLLDHLWINRDRVVAYDELIARLYGDDPDFDRRADPHESLRKLVARLRRVLAPDNTGPSSYVDHVPGRGYVLRNVVDETR